MRDPTIIRDPTIRILQRVQRALKSLDEVLADPAPAEEELDSEDDEDGTEVQRIYNGLVDKITCLNQLSFAIRRPAPHDRLLGTRREDTASFEPFDRQQVSDKYPQVDSIVVDRLGAAILLRRAVLKYRERNHERFKKRIDHRLDDQTDTENDETRPTFEDTASGSSLSQTSYSQTLLQIQEQDIMTVHSPPKESANGATFECPYCYFVIIVNNLRSWASHIFRDIMPYICVFPDCPSSNRQYDSRRECGRHLLNVHLVSSDPATKVDCPLCKDRVPTGRHFERHLGRHLEELALFALPRTGVDGANVLNEEISDAVFCCDVDDDDNNSRASLSFLPDSGNG